MWYCSQLFAINSCTCLYCLLVVPSLKASLLFIKSSTVTLFFGLALLNSLTIVSVCFLPTSFPSFAPSIIATTVGCIISWVSATVALGLPSKSFMASMMFLPLSMRYWASASLNNGCPFSTAALSSGVISMECWVDCAELSFFIE